MKKYLMSGVAAIALLAAFTSCTKSTDLYDQGAVDEKNKQEQQKKELTINEKYAAAFENAFGKVAPTVDWGFGPTSVAGVRGGTRAVPSFPDDNDFRDINNVNEPGTIRKPTITKTDNAIIISGEKTLNNISDNSVVYLESDAVLTLSDWFSLQNVKFYMSSGSTLNAQNLYLKGNTEFVNDGGTINIGNANYRTSLVMDNFTGTFWSNGTINVSNSFSTSNGEGGNIYFGSSSVLNATNLFLFKKVLLRNEGEITLTGEFNADQYGHKIYNSGTITTPKIILQKNTDLWNEGTITAANNKEVTASISNDDVHIYNGTNATLKLDAMTLTNNRQLVVNDGILNVKGKITTQNNSEIVNYKELTGGEFEMMSGSKFYNVAGGEVNITGLSKIANDGNGNLDNNVWLNSGKYTTGSFEATGGCQYPQAFNNCRMNVTGKFFMNHCNFVLDGGAAVVCGSFEWQSDNYFHMGGKALLKVEGQLLANNQNNSPQYGFWGDDTEYAVIKAGSIEKGSKGKCRAAYYGNLFIDTNNHFTQGENSADGTWYTFGDNVKFSFTDNTDVSGYQTSGAKTAKKDENFSIDIPADDKGCTPGYKYGTKVTYRVIAEDLNAEQKSDFDFNDVVFDVEPNEAGTAAKIVLQAAGGIYRLTVGDADHGIKEIHEAFGASADPTTGEYPMINTENYDPGFAVTLFESYSGSFNTDANIRATIKNIPIIVYKPVNGEILPCTLTATTGEPACKILVDKSFDIVKERQDISNQYQKFTKYVGGFVDDFWWK